MTPSKALQEFVSEAQDVVEALTRGLDDLGKARGREPDPALIHRLFRLAHSLKGLSGMFGVAGLARLAHASEDLLDDARMGRAPITGSFVDLLAEAGELAQRMIAELSAGEDPDRRGGTAGDGAALVARIEATRRREAGGRGEEPLEVPGLSREVRAVLTEYEEHRLRENLIRGRRLLRLRATYDLADFERRLGELNARLEGAGEVISTLPSADPAGGSRISFDLLFASEKPSDAVAAALGGLADASPWDPGAASGAGPGPGAAPAGEERRASLATPSLRSASQTVRVDIARLDRLMALVGDLAVARANLDKLSEAVRGGAVSDAPLVGAALQRETRSLARALDGLQKGLLEVRLVPLEQIFEKLARMVRKVARESGKEVELAPRGGEVELDKLILEDLADPLLHLIRNAIDHGIEAPAERERAGKPRAGVIGLSARQRGHHVVLEVSDDGAGIDEEAVRAKALERGLVDAAALRSLGRREALNFIFLPGFSTAARVSEISGRGVGLDVVKTNIARLSGIIDLTSARGVGTTFAITLPVTLAIVRALMVGVAGRAFALPLYSVLEILQVDPREVSTIETREVIDLRGATLPLVRLSRLFRLEGSPPGGPLFVVVVGLAQDRLGIAVDELGAQQDVVVKPLGPALAGVRGIAGATDLGQRQTVLVLDVGGIIDEVLSSERTLRAAM